MKLLLIWTLVTSLTVGIATESEMLTINISQEYVSEPAAVEETVVESSQSLLFGEEMGVMTPDITEEIITETEQIMNILGEYNCWSSADEYKHIMWIKENGRFRTLSEVPFMDYLPDVYGDGEWYFEGNMLVLDDMDSVFMDQIQDYADEVGQEDLLDEYNEYVTNAHIPMAAEIDGTLHLYLCSQYNFIDYVPATDDEKLQVSTDNDQIANIRYFMCSATWLLVGHYDENENYSHRSNTRAYTFLMDGQLVVRDNGVNYAGYYTINLGENGFADLTYVLEDGTGLNTPLWLDNSSSYASSMFIYPEFGNNESDVYMAKSKYGVSGVVTEGDPIERYPGS